MINDCPGLSSSANVRGSARRYSYTFKLRRTCPNKRTDGQVAGPQTGRAQERSGDCKKSETPFEGANHTKRARPLLEIRDSTGDGTHGLVISTFPATPAHYCSAGQLIPRSLACTLVLYVAEALTVAEFRRMPKVKKQKTVLRKTPLVKPQRSVKQQHKPHTQAPKAPRASAALKCSSVIDQQSAEAVAKLLAAAETRTSGATIKSLTLAPHIVHKKPTFAVTCETLKHLLLLKQLLAEVGVLEQGHGQVNTPAASTALLPNSAYCLKKLACLC